MAEFPAEEITKTPFFAILSEVTVQGLLGHPDSSPMLVEIMSAPSSYALMWLAMRTSEVKPGLKQFIVL